MQPDLPARIKKKEFRGHRTTERSFTLPKPPLDTLTILLQRKPNSEIPLSRIRYASFSKAIQLLRVLR